jgi:hypothetical protein
MSGEFEGYKIHFCTFAGRVNDFEASIITDCNGCRSFENIITDDTVHIARLSIA